MARVTPRRRATAAMSERAALLGRDGDRPSSSRATRDRARARDDAYDVERARGEIDADDDARDAGDRARGGETTRSERRREEGMRGDAGARRASRSARWRRCSGRAREGRGRGTRARRDASAALGLTPSRARGVHARSG